MPPALDAVDKGVYRSLQVVDRALYGAASRPKSHDDPCQNPSVSRPDPPPYQVPDEARAAAIRRVLEEYLQVEPLEPGFAKRLLAEGIRSFIELGAAHGPISQLLAPAGVECTAVDLDPPADHFEPLLRADLRSIPLPDNSVDAVSAVNCLYFLGDPRDGIREAHRLLRPGGLFLASSPSRRHDPEIKRYIPDWGVAGPFDAEEAEAVVTEVFGEVEADWWEVPAYVLTTADQVRDYFTMFGYPEPDAAVADLGLPITITKSGINIWARKAA